jgi:hypothetical protein
VKQADLIDESSETTYGECSSRKPNEEDLVVGGVKIIVLADESVRVSDVSMKTYSVSVHSVVTSKDHRAPLPVAPSTIESSPKVDFRAPMPVA